MRVAEVEDEIRRLRMENKFLKKAAVNSTDERCALKEAREGQLSDHVPVFVAERVTVKLLRVSKPRGVSDESASH